MLLYPPSPSQESLLGHRAVYDGARKNSTSVTPAKAVVRSTVPSRRRLALLVARDAFHCTTVAGTPPTDTVDSSGSKCA